MKWFRDIGPGVLIAAAFIGPGTVTLCTIAGAFFWILINLGNCFVNIFNNRTSRDVSKNWFSYSNELS